MSHSPPLEPCEHRTRSVWIDLLGLVLLTLAMLTFVPPPHSVEGQTYTLFPGVYWTTGLFALALLVMYRGSRWKYLLAGLGGLMALVVALFQVDALNIVIAEYPGHFAP